MLFMFEKGVTDLVIVIVGRGVTNVQEGMLLFCIEI